MLFISYRRNDDPGHAGRLHDFLKQSFSPAHIFMDVMGSIPPGVDWHELIRERAAACDVLLAVIGTRWMQLWADDPERDYVLLELRIALERGKRIIPVLVGGAAEPKKEELPAPIQALARLQVLRLSTAQFGEDCQRLIETLHELLEPREAADWQAATELGTESALRDFLEKWPQGKHAALAGERLSPQLAPHGFAPHPLAADGVTRRHLTRGALVVSAGMLLDPEPRPRWPQQWPQRPPDYFQSFDVQGDERKIRQQLGSFWLLGDDGTWTGAVDDGVYRLINRTQSDGAKRFNFALTAPDGRRRALGDAPVSVETRIQSRADAAATPTSSAGLIYRFDRASSDYVALTVGSAGYRLLQRHHGVLRQLYAERYPGCEKAAESFQSVGLSGEGRSLRVYINHRFVRTIEVEVVEGDVGLIALSTGVFEFDNLSIWHPQSATRG